LTELIAGVDEAGRGPLAGPVVAAAVILDPRRPIRGLRDSKQLPAERREVLALRIRERAIAWAVAEADHEEIDLINILQATLLAMKRALLQLQQRPTTIMIDGNCSPYLFDCFADCNVRTLVGGDAILPSISAASIIAKTYRDALMVGMCARYPGYGMSQHFGYGTPQHLHALVHLGPSPIHRRSFNPLRSWLTDALPWGVSCGEPELE
jgi:ribonuclease HII